MFTELYREEKREEGDRGVQDDKGGIKRRESKLAINHFPVCSPVCIPRRCSQSYTEKRRVRKETEVARRIKGGIKRRETEPASNQFPKCSSLSETHKGIHRVG